MKGGITTFDITHLGLLSSKLNFVHSPPFHFRELAGSGSSLGKRSRLVFTLTPQTQWGWGFLPLAGPEHTSSSGMALMLCFGFS